MFKPGDKVICIDSKPLNPARITQLELGKEYVVKGVTTRPCCNIRLVDVGAKTINPRMKYYCTCGLKMPPNLWSAAWRFIKLDGLTEEQVEVQEVQQSH